ncbi:hypothetical protein Trydic_g19053 [Trypoxylus dichotomus]
MANRILGGYLRPHTPSVGDGPCGSVQTNQDGNRRRRDSVPERTLSGRDSATAMCFCLITQSGRKLDRK